MSQWELNMVIIVALSHWAGMIRYLVINRHQKFNFRDCLNNMLISGFTGYVASLIGYELDLEQGKALGLSLIAAYGGSATLSRLSGRFHDPE